MLIAEEVRSFSATLPAPVGGWNARDLPDGMPPTDAIRLVNYFPEQGSVGLRRGYTEHADGMGGPVQTVAEWVGADGTRKLIAAANGTIWDATSSGAASSLAGSKTNNKWQTVNFRHKLILVNGADTPLQYDSTAGLTTATYTGSGLTATDLINVSSYKNRLYFVESNSASIWYGAVDAITGALTEFDLSSLLSRGGYVLFAGTATRDTGIGVEDFFVIGSSEGEVLIYGGAYPGSTDWGLIGRAHIGKPLGRRAYRNIGGNLAIVTDEGIAPIKYIISQNEASGVYNYASDKIKVEFRKKSEFLADSFGWDVLLFPRGEMAIVNIPTAENVSAEQYVVNINTNAWCRFTGIPAISWTLYDDWPYFGGPGGQVYRFWDGNSDDSSAIEGDIKQAFSYPNEDRGSIKRITLAKPIFTGDTAIDVSMDMDYDFEETETIQTISVEGVSGSAWDEVYWDEADWDSPESYRDDWYAVTGHGRCVSPKIKASFLNAPHRLSGWQVIYEQGGPL